MQSKNNNKKASAFSIGFFLAYRQIKHSSLWTTCLMIVMMILIFLNLVVINGILVGLIESSIQGSRDKYSGEIIISKLAQKSAIENSENIINTLKNFSEVEEVMPRTIVSGKISLDYNKVLRQEETRNEAMGNISGIDTTLEDRSISLSKRVIEGNYLDDKDTKGVLVGAFLINEYTPIDAPGFRQLRGVKIGDRVKITVGQNSKEMFVRGIVKSKIDDIDGRVFMIQSEAQKLLGKGDSPIHEIAVKLKKGSTEEQAIHITNILKSYNYGFDAKIQTAKEAEPKFLKDMKELFGFLGNFLGSIGLIVACITVFIVIFVNTITRRKFIGILKGIGISPKAIEYSYILQSAFYAIVGSSIGLALLYGFLVPYIDKNPINFPFSDGILYAPLSGTLIRVAILIFVTICAAYIPAKMIVKKNTLDSILGR